MERQDERRESIARVHVVAKGEGVRVGDVRGHFFRGGGWTAWTSWKEILATTEVADIKPLCLSRARKSLWNTQVPA